MAADMAFDFQDFGIAAISIWMGILLTERLKNIVASDPAEVRPPAGNRGDSRADGRISSGRSSTIPDLME